MCVDGVLGMLTMVMILMLMLFTINLFHAVRKKMSVFRCVGSSVFSQVYFDNRFVFD